MATISTFSLFLRYFWGFWLRKLLVKAYILPNSPILSHFYGQVSTNTVDYLLEYAFFLLSFKQKKQFEILDYTMSI